MKKMQKNKVGTMEKMKKDEFDQIFDLMKLSFPIIEYRDYDAQKALLSDPNYQILTLPDTVSGFIKAFMAIWEFEELIYIEHFAVSPRFRNHGLGAVMLQELLSSTPKQVCLEVELPQTEIAARRIAFYERNHFVFNPYPYMQPSLGAGRAPQPLRIMTSDHAITRSEFEAIRALLYRYVYHAETEESK